MKLTNDDGSWSDELLAACKPLSIPPNQHPEVLALAVKPYPAPAPKEAAPAPKEAAPAPDAPAPDAPAA